MSSRTFRVPKEVLSPIEHKIVQRRLMNCLSRADLLNPRYHIAHFRHPFGRNLEFKSIRVGDSSRAQVQPSVFVVVVGARLIMQITHIVSGAVKNSFVDLVGRRL